ncbi:extracellular solute-binding protein [Ktedonosporobacter rubrisoli]|uniref:Extracellular solute-binding protein n=1 Tax=Ktedonosporobacter rubrisoli TaxID=2509675 RepID=A0A4P6K460_KTERU|nr:extracellular solute-binding protein [Ktedonosporobacter rubrisoli]QBD82999.1 extracellular solute-binding protein [Ktedonosporobacter rubrisoli]
MLAKKSFLVLVTLLSLLILSSCGGSFTQNSSKNGSTAKAPINVAVFSGPEADAIKALGPQYTKQTGIPIQFTSFEYDQLYSKEVQSATSNTANYDILFMDDPWIPTFASGNYLYPLDHFSNFNAADQGFVSGALQVDQWPPAKPELAPKGVDQNTAPHYYALPITTNVLMFFYRKDLAQKYGVSPQQWTWDDVNTLADKVKGTGVSGFVLRGQGGNSGVADFTPLLWAYGGTYFKSNWTSALNSPQAIAALTEWKKLFGYGPSGSASFGADQVGNAMEQNQAAMAEIWPSGWAGKMPANVAIATVPGMKDSSGALRQAPVVGVWSIGVAKNSAHADEAFQFMKWLTSAQQEKQYGSSGDDLPTLQSVLLDTTIDQKWPFYKPVYDALQVSHMRPRTPAWPHVETALGNELVKVELGQETPQQALQIASNEIDQYMSQNGLSS